jgi:hypothetical protein
MFLKVLADGNQGFGTGAHPCQRCQMEFDQLQPVAVRRLGANLL